MNDTTDGIDWGDREIGEPRLDAWFMASVLWMVGLGLAALAAIFVAHYPFESLAMAGFLALAVLLGRITARFLPRNDYRGDDLDSGLPPED